MIEWWSINAGGYAEKALMLLGVKQPTLTYRYEETGVAHAVRVAESSSQSTAPDK
jgi:hypothetical protein